MRHILISIRGKNWKYKEKRVVRKASRGVVRFAGMRMQEAIRFGNVVGEWGNVIQRL